MIRKKKVALLILIIVLFLICLYSFWQYNKNIKMVEINPDHKPIITLTGVNTKEAKDCGLIDCWKKENTKIDF